VSTNPNGDEPGHLWVVDICDDRMLDKSASDVWDDILSVRNSEQSEAKKELDRFIAVMRHPDSSCVTRAAFEMIEGGAVLSEPCGRCPSCRARGLDPPRILTCSGLETAWSTIVPSACVRLPAGVTLLSPHDANFERDLKHLGIRLAQIGVEQFIVAPSHTDAMAEALKQIESRFGFVVAYDEWTGPPTSLARIATAVLLPADDELARDLLSRVRELTLAWPETIIVVVARPDRELEGRRLDQTVSARAPISESTLDELVAAQEVA
jgi:ATP-dependent DNA helicase RecQ